MRSFSSVLLSACSSPMPPVVCVAGKSESCIGPGGCAGGQQCNADGTGFGACDCGGSVSTDAGSTVTDAGLPTCNLTGAEPASRYGNSVGICFQHAGSFYDSNIDGTLDAMWPRCTSLTTGDVVPPVQVPAGNDALEFACLPYPMRKQAEALVRPVAPTVLPHRFINWR